MSHPLHGFGTLLERTPALAPACGAVLSALAVLLSPWLWIAAGLALVVFRCVDRRPGLWYSIACMAVVCTALLQAPEPLPQQNFYRTERYRCEVRRSEVHGNSRRLLVALRSGARSYPVRVSVMSTEPGVLAGDSILLRCCLRPSEASSGTPLLHMNRNERVAATALVGAEDIALLQPSRSLRFFPVRLGGRLRQAVARSTLSDSACALLTSALFGTATAGTAADIHPFRTAGLSHLLCVSGFHVGLIFLLLEFLLSPLKLWFAHPALKTALILPAIWLFIAATGAYAPAIRAGVMVTLFALAALLERKRLSLNALCCAIAIIIIAAPSSVFSIGLWLGFSAVFALIMMLPVLNTLKPTSPLWRLVSWSAGSVAAYLGTLPVILAAFHSVSLVSVLANVLVVPLFPVFVWSGLGLVALNGLGLEAAWLKWIPEALCNYFSLVADTFSTLPGTILKDVYLSPAGTAFLLAGMAIVICSFGLRKRPRILSVSAVGMTMVLIAFVLPMRPTAPQVVMANNICVDTRGRSATVYSFSAQTELSPYRHYFARRGIVPDSIHLMLNAATMPGPGGPLHVVRIPEDLENAPEGALYVRTNSRKVLDSLIHGPYRPPLVVLDASVSGPNRLRLSSHFRAAGCQVHDLWMQPLEFVNH